MHVSIYYFMSFRQIFVTLSDLELNYFLEKTFGFGNRLVIAILFF